MFCLSISCSFLRSEFRSSKVDFRPETNILNGNHNISAFSFFVVSIKRGEFWFNLNQQQNWRKKRTVKNDVTVAMACVVWRALSGIGARATGDDLFTSVLLYFVLLSFVFLQEGQLNTICLVTLLSATGPCCYFTS